MSVLVFVETQNGKYKKAAFEAVSYAKTVANKIGEEISVVALNPTEPSEALYKYGANKVIKVNAPELENFAPFAIAELLKSHFTSDYIVMSSANDSATVAPILAQKTDAALVTNLLEEPSSTDPFVAKRKAFSGKGIETIEAVNGKKVLTVLQNAFGLKENPVAGTEETIEADATAAKLQVVETMADSGGAIDLKEAEIVISAGRGLKGAENWGMVEELAGLLGAATACSKPVSDMGWRPHSEHVGQTGKAISPNLYIAIGISGAIQHLAGVNSSKHIVVINTDEEAPFFKSADYGVVGDAFNVLPDLINEIKAYKGV